MQNSGCFKTLSTQKGIAGSVDGFNGKEKFMSNENNRKLLSVIVPCYNEAKVLDGFHEELEEQLHRIAEATQSLRSEQGVQLGSNYDYEIIYVNDGSTDASLNIMKGLAEEDRCVRYISLSRNFGKESAMLAGLEHAEGDCAVIMDADMQHPPELIPEMLAQYEVGFDQVIAKRDRKGETARSRFFAKMYYKLVNLVVDVKMEDGAGDFRLLSRRAIDAVLELKETNRFSKGIFSWVGFNQTYIEYENRQRAADVSHWSFRKLLRYGIDGVVSFNVQPLRVCVYMGISLLALSMLYLLYLLVQIIMHGVDVPGYFTTIAMISIIGGVQLISLGVIGEYVGRIYAEVKKRPAYIVAERSGTSIGCGSGEAEAGKIENEKNN